ncbi:hypothetical protein KA005_42520 [bacterium]|nr:hypothetical protein [bacterium]
MAYALFVLLVQLVLWGFVYFIVGCGVVLLIVTVLRDRETFEDVEMPSSFELAVVSWPYRVYLCFVAWTNRNGTEETDDLKKNPLD